MRGKLIGTILALTPALWLASAARAQCPDGICRPQPGQGKPQTSGRGWWETMQHVPVAPEFDSQGDLVTPVAPAPKRGPVKDPGKRPAPPAAAPGTETAPPSVPAPAQKVGPRKEPPPQAPRQEQEEEPGEDGVPGRQVGGDSALRQKLEGALTPTIYDYGLPTPGIAAMQLEGMMNLKDPFDFERMKILKQIEAADNWGKVPKNYEKMNLRDVVKSLSYEYNQVGKVPEEPSASESYTQNWTYNGP